MSRPSFEGRLRRPPQDEGGIAPLLRHLAADHLAGRRVFAVVLAIGLGQRAGDRLHGKIEQSGLRLAPPFAGGILRRAHGRGREGRRRRQQTGSGKRRKDANFMVSPCSVSGMLVDRIDPGDRFRLLHRLDVEIDHHRLVVGAHQNAFERRVGGGVDLLMRHIGRHEDEVARPGLGDIFQMIAPAHARLALDHVDDAFQCAMVMGAGLGIGLDLHRARPDLLGADAGEVDRGGAVHARRLRGIGIELVAGDDLHPVRLPVDRFLLCHRPLPLPLHHAMARPSSALISLASCS